MKKIDELAVLIGRSPRVAKRFLNCYRLLKGRMNQAELEKFLEGSFHYVIEILAIIVGAPSISRVVVDALSTEGGARDGRAFLEYLAKHLSPETLATSDGVEIARMLSACTSDHLKSLRAIVPLVSRFSFATQTEQLPNKLRVRPRKPKSATPNRRVKRTATRYSPVGESTLFPSGYPETGEQNAMCVRASIVSFEELSRHCTVSDNGWKRVVVH
jgi:hypothetical protein